LIAIFCTTLVVYVGIKILHYYLTFRYSLWLL
jgi:hypothetical protein